MRINLAEYLGIDDSKCKVPLGMVDDIRIDEFKNGGPVVAVTYLRDKNERNKNKEMLKMLVSNILKCDANIDYNEYSEYISQFKQD